MLINILGFLLTSFPIIFTKVTFYTNTYPPFSDCTRYSTESSSSAVFGAEIELVRSGLTFLNWTEGLDYSFDCNQYDFQTPTNSTNKLDVGLIGGITMTSERIKNSFKFCQPTASAPLRLGYRRVPLGWFFTRGLDTFTWIFLLVTIFLVGGLLYFMEDRKTAYINMLYNVLGQIFLVPDHHFSKFGSKLIDYLSTFLVVITVIIFTAISTNIFQYDRDFGSILSLENISNDQLVYGNAVFADYLSKFGIPFASADDYNAEDFMYQIDRLGIRYFLLDGPYSDFLVRQHCDLYTTASEIDLIHYGIMLQKEFPKKLEILINEGIFRAKEIKSFEEYVTDYYNTLNNLTICSDKTQQQQQQAVALNEIRGLLYIFLCGFGVAIGFVIISWFSLILKKNMHIYDLGGVRSKMDRKIQRRVSTVFAIHASVSIQSIIFLKKLSQMALENHLNALKKSLNPSFLLFAFLQDHRRIEVIPDQSKPTFKVSPLKWIKRNATLKRISMLKKSSTMGKPNNFQKFGRRKLRSSIELGKTHFNFNDTSAKDRIADQNECENEGMKMLSSKRRNAIHKEIKPLQREGPRKSTLLTQSTQAFHFNNKLHLKLETLIEKETEKEIDHHHNLPNIEEHSLISLQDTPKNQEKKNTFYKKISTLIENKAINFIGKVFGRKGIKKNTKINMIGNTLLAEKEATLDLELCKKKSEVISRKGTLGLHGLRKASTLLIKDKMALHKQTDKDFYQDPPRSKARSSFCLESPCRERENEEKDYHHIMELSNKNFSESILLKSFSTIKKGQPWHEEDYNFEMQSESFKEKGDFSPQSLDIYNFSGIINSISHRTPKKHRFAEESKIKEKEDSNLPCSGD